MLTHPEDAPLLFRVEALRRQSNRAHSVRVISRLNGNVKKAWQLMLPRVESFSSSFQTLLYHHFSAGDDADTLR